MSTDRWMDKEDVVYIYNGILLIHKKEWNNAICSIWMNLEITLSEINHRKRNIIWYHLYVESKIMIQMNLFTRQKQTHRHRKQT